ncbi:ABC transporter ATP-binding protein [Agrobacterium tumefaciens]|jgi:multiple sugar transport system ATP-binding protein|uniref:Sn-glycerol-3-phosphate ABC transporter ATP-binding protein UgpC n=1 Tax=Agrobacterium tumefaciens TaxID=358 RepID=A0AA44F2I9_AGRTU|nr:sn-glycerol-3-phosphate ABC transporter ATP-binding protein UgpC [Agrobacterium tumefaciens]NSL23004.1 sn-glycerol-3-phosphate ABC transporter ATP-binding protein UgpC [Agrobacterium tumefaciens]NTB89244.1 sn-glycerol-3-phosphate ABC transporter ATP-binding protein UgpC [Agrobacterium tumefaciens]NTC20515.1 sn-glycerol-3-phosphate ABC transporter ATP-binding protein UgpC [Agrobacterium tumefaciens]NTC27885.1 sn-glycerol-3-phosphate ABC transporter ATP-binding protein UgpC [Agrobacterium tume
MAGIALSNINKIYGNSFHALQDLSFDIKDGEFMVFVGPSGCGKSTALRMIAGLETITSGELRIGDKLINDVDPKDRDIAMVFQSYALYPHKTVRENIAFPLLMAGLPKTEIANRVEEAARILELTNLLDRKPALLSGGQRQRVAMGRAIVRKPAAFLMDEPLSNLDAKLRVQMRAEIARIQKKLNVTTIYVTHDQVEAMTMGDRVAVMKGGVLQQVDTPQNLYSRPDNVFVAAFIGSPSMNLYDATLHGSMLTLGSNSFQIPDRVFQERPNLVGSSNRRVIIGIRPEHMNDAALKPSSAEISAPVTLVEALGSESMVHLNIDAPWVDAGDPDAVQDIADEKAAVARFSPKSTVRVGDNARISIDAEEIHFFDPDSRASIW